MIKPYKTCRIEPGKVRLAELAEHFGFDPEELRWFHNQYCPINDLIDPDIQLHVEVIYIPVPEMDTGFYKKQNSKNQVFEKSGRLSVPRFFEKRYGIIQTMRENGEEKMQIHYETELNKTGLNNLFIKRNPVYINKKRPDLLMDKWADEVGNIFYPLHLELYDNAKLRHIANFPEIQKRWKEKKKELGNYYKGKTAEDFLEKIDRQFEYRGRTQRGILDSWFFCLYFFPLYESFDKDKTYTFQVSLPVFPKKPKVGFEITLSLEGSVFGVTRIQHSG